MKKLGLLVLVTGLIFCFTNLETAKAGGNPFGDGGGDQYGAIMNTRGPIGRVVALWEWKGGGLIAMDDFNRGMTITFCNGRPIYGKMTMAPDVTVETDIAFEALGLDGKTSLGDFVISGINLMSFFGWTKDAEGHLIADTQLEEYLALVLKGKKAIKDGFGDFTTDEIAQIAVQVRNSVAKVIAANGAPLDANGEVDTAVLTQAEMLYSYDQGTSQLKNILRTATDDEGNLLKDDKGTPKWTTETYAAGLLVSRSTFFYGIKLTDTNNDGVGDTPEYGDDGRPVLDKSKLIEGLEVFEYSNTTADPGGVLIGSVQTGSKLICTKASSDGLFQVGDVMSETINDAFGRVEEEKGVVYVETDDSGKAIGYEIGLLTKHIYSNATGLETQTINYSKSDTGSISMRVTDRLYNADNRLTSTKTTLLTQHFAQDLNNDGDTDDEGENAWDEVKGVVGSSSIAYNSLGQTYYVDTTEVDVEGGSGGQSYRTYYVFGRELVRFNKGQSQF